MRALANKVCIVTGASSGIGRATALVVRARGRAPVITARRQPELELVVADIEREGGEACALAGDVQDETLAGALVELAQSRFGGLDLAFNNAGTLGALCPAVELAAADWEARCAPI